MTGPELPTVLRGVGIGEGRVAGPVVRWEPIGAGPPADEAQGAPGDELARATAALEATAAALEQRAGATDGPAREILEAVVLMARDPTLRQAVSDAVASGLSAERAVWDAFEHHRAALEAAGGYFGARAADVADLRDRVVARLQGRLPDRRLAADRCVLVAADLAPADTAGLDSDRVAALVTEQGGPTSHTAIIARAAGLPAVVSCRGAMSLVDGAVVIVDARAGTVEPHSAGTLVRPLRRAPVARLTAAPATADGHRVELLANVGGPAEARAARATGAEGVGLFRTEFCFLDRTDPPSVAEQAAAYREVFDAFPGRKVVIRTLDAGADKPLPFLGLADEPNPALGIRGLRAHRRRPELLYTQLRAIAHAASGSRATVWVMAPMVADAADARWFRDQTAAHALRQVGVMVEVPSAALGAHELLLAADFVSIGTNDLSQYALAADRQAGGLAPYQDPWHPGVLRLVELTARAARAVRKPVGVCGEAAADPALACVLVGLGVTSLSATAAALGAVHAALAAATLEQCRAMAAAALAAGDAAVARANAGRAA